MDDPAEPSLPVYNTKAVAEVTGIPAETLRSWERRFGVPRPSRATTGYRLYSREDLRVIRWLQARLAWIIHRGVVAPWRLFGYGRGVDA